ncbi:MAG: hypothetical protein J5501_02220 [Ruminococcus sp.]|nr:hypothetical protein [Ruminococcus sp.]
MDKMIDEKLNGFAFFYNLFQKSGEYDADDTIEVDDCNYEFCRAIDQSVIGSLAELKTLIENTTSGQLKEDMMYCCNRRFREKDGILYVNPVNGSYYPVIPEYGISVTDKTENRFCVIPALRTFGGYYRVVFTETDGEWTISDINSGVFDVNNSVYDHEIAAETKASDLNSILYNLSNGGDPNAEDKITVDGVEYAKADDQVATPAYMENWINRACTGELRDSLLEECRRFIIEKDGVVYREITSKDKWKYGYTNDWMLLSATPDSCRIANANNNELSSYYIIELRKAEGEWRLSRYTIGEFPEERLFFGCVSADADKIDFMEEANIDSRKLFSISKDTRLGIFESGTPGWYKVEYCGCTGYVSADYIKNIDVPEKTVDIGDANEDGKITVSDAVAVLQYIANAEKYALTEQGKKNADCDGEEGITGGDAITIQKIDAGVI